MMYRRLDVRTGPPGSRGDRPARRDLARFGSGPCPAGCRAPRRSRRNPCRRGRAARPRPGIRGSARRARRRRRAGRRRRLRARDRPERRGSGTISDGIGRRLRRRASSSAALVATRYAQVENSRTAVERSILRAIASSASCVASSASSGLPSIRRQTPWTSDVCLRSSASSARRVTAGGKLCELLVRCIGVGSGRAPHRRCSLLPIDPGDSHEPGAGVDTDDRADRADDDLGVGDCGSSIARNSSMSGALACNTLMISTLPAGIWSTRNCSALERVRTCPPARPRRRSR